MHSHSEHPSAPPSSLALPSSSDVGPNIDTVSPLSTSPAPLQEEPDIQTQIQTHCTKIEQGLILSHAALTLTDIHEPYTIIEDLPDNAITDYNFSRRRLHIRFRSTPQHQAVGVWANSLWMFWAYTGLLTAEECNSCDIGFLRCYLRSRNYDYLPEAESRCQPGTERHNRGATTQDRWSIRDHKTSHVLRPVGTYSPSVVFEAGWTQKEESLRGIAAQWLVKGGGRIRVCVLVGIEEEEMQAKNQAAVRELRREILNNARDGNANENSNASDTSNSPDPIAWVGPVRVWLEVWRYNDETGEPYLENNKRWPVMDETCEGSQQPSDSNPMPSLSVSDIFPHARPQTTPAPQAPVDTRRFILDLDKLRENIPHAKKDYAFDRERIAAANIEVEMGL